MCFSVNRILLTSSWNPPLDRNLLLIPFLVGLLILLLLLLLLLLCFLPLRYGGYPANAPLLYGGYPPDELVSSLLIVGRLILAQLALRRLILPMSLMLLLLVDSFTAAYPADELPVVNLCRPAYPGSTRFTAAYPADELFLLLLVNVAGSPGLSLYGGLSCR